MARDQQNWFEQLQECSRTGEIWYVRWGARVAWAVLMVMWLPVLCVVVFPLALIGGMIYTIGNPIWRRWWWYPRLVRRMQQMGRMIELDECRRQCDLGNGTLLFEVFQSGAVLAWWTPDAIEPLEADPMQWRPGRTRAEAERFARASERTVELRRRYADEESGSGMLVRGMTRGVAKEMQQKHAARTIELCFWVFGPGKWWQFMDVGSCKACGYDLGGLEAGAVCPECGSAGEGG